MTLVSELDTGRCQSVALDKTERRNRIKGPCIAYPGGSSIVDRVDALRTIKSKPRKKRGGILAKNDTGHESFNPPILANLHR